jgi:hypothetical protein
MQPQDKAVHLVDALDVNKVFQAIHDAIEDLEDEVYEEMSRGTFWTEEEIQNASRDAIAGRKEPA